MHDYLVGSLPFTYRMVGFLAGFHGDRESGIRTLRVGDGERSAGIGTMQRSSWRELPAGTQGGGGHACF